MTVDIYIENERIDVFETDSINITQSVQNINDISKVFADFSQSFSVPSSDNNNRIFKHYYNADVDNGFDARLLNNAFININSIPFKFGKIRLEGADVENNKPKTYKLTFFGDAIKVKELLGDDKLFDLEWLTNFNHEYSGDKVKEGLTTGIDFTVDSVSYPKAITYPLISYDKQYFYNSDPSDTTATDVLTNIAYDSGRTIGVDYRQLKPAIRISLIIKAIEEQYNLPFLSMFFGDERFNEAYMNINRDTETLVTGLSVFEDASRTWTQNGLFIGGSYTAIITPKSGFENTKYKVRLTYNDNVVYESPSFFQGANTFSATALEFTRDYKVKAEVITESSFEFDAETRLRFLDFSPPFNTTINEINTYTNQSISLQVDLGVELPNIKVLDWLTDVFKMYNIVTYAESQDINAETLPDWYAKGQIYDITLYVDTEKVNVKRGKIYREINFNFEESEQILADEYRQSNNENYGDLEFKLTNPDGTPLDNLTGDVLNIEVLFENPINERLIDQNTGQLTKVQYNPYFNREIKSISGNPFILFCPIVSISESSIGFNNDSGYEELTSVILPSHSIIIDEPSFNLNFNAVVNEYTGQVMPKTLFNQFYEDYITDIFSIKRRLYNYKGVLPTSILNKLKLNDRLVIRNTRYIINKLTSNIVNRDRDADDLELINDIYDAPLASDLLRSSRFRDSVVNFNKNASSGTNLYYGVVGTLTKEDVGFGTSFLTLNTTDTINGITQVNFDVSENNTGANRIVRIRCTDGINNPSFIVNQSSGTITADNNVATADNDITTVDNG